MIIKIYDDDGRPDLGRWQITCDTPGCYHITLLVGSADWLVPADPGMSICCPTCVWGMAACLITWAIRCPGCGDPDIRLWQDPDLADPARPYYAQCEGCGASLWSFTDADQLGDLIDGWDLPREGGWWP